MEQVKRLQECSAEEARACSDTKSHEHNHLWLRKYGNSIENPHQLNEGKANNIQQEELQRLRSADMKVHAESHHSPRTVGSKMDTHHLSCDCKGRRSLPWSRPK